jgi:hypothetical protein
MSADFPYTTTAAVFGSALLAPIIVAAIKRRFPARPGEKKEFEELSREFDALEKSSTVVGFVGFFLAICVIVQKSAAADTFMILFGSLAFLPVLHVFGIACWRRDAGLFSNFVRFQEVKYGISGGFVTAFMLFCALLFPPGIILFMLR